MPTSIARSEALCQSNRLLNRENTYPVLSRNVCGSTALPEARCFCSDNSLDSAVTRHSGYHKGMSLFGPQTSRSIPTPPTGQPVAAFATYAEAQRAVDYLADNAFTVPGVTIVGTNLQMVERVTGRLSYPRVALAGMMSGAWFGLMVGVLFSLFSNDAEFFSTAATAVGFGCAFGMLFAVLSYAFTGGKRDFTSTSQVVAGTYIVLCTPETASDATALLRQGPGTGLPLPPVSVAPAPAPFPRPTSQTPYVPHNAQQQAPTSHDAAAPQPEVASPAQGLTYGEALDLKKREAEQQQNQNQQD